MQGGMSGTAPYDLVHRELRRAADVSRSAQERGKALEDAAVAAFLTVPGCDAPGRRAVDPRRSAEIDIVVSNRRREDGLFFLPEVFLVECKNSDNAVTADAVRSFQAKVRVRGLQLGVLIASAGATGARGRRDAAHHAAALAMTLGNRLLLVTTRELRALSADGDFVALLHGKFFELAASGTFGADA